MDNKPTDKQHENPDKNGVAETAEDKLMKKYARDNLLIEAINHYIKLALNLSDKEIGSEETATHLRFHAKEIIRITTDAVGGQYFLEAMVANHPLGSDLPPDEAKKFIETLQAHVKAFFDELKNAISADRKRLFDAMQNGSKIESEWGEDSSEMPTEDEKMFLFDTTNYYFKSVFDLSDEEMASKESDPHFKASAREIVRITTDAVGSQCSSAEEDTKALQAHIKAFFDKLESAVAENREGLFNEMKKR